MILVKTAEALAHVHKVGFLHNNLKANNIVLENNRMYNPVVIYFGKTVPLGDARGPKVFSEECKRQYARDFPHFGPKIVGGIKGKSIASDILA